MVAAEVLAQIKELKLHAHKILQSSSGGVAQSKQHGFGFDFDQLRNYVYGDDVRRIDWKSSARSPGSLYVRQYFQERNSSYLICVDISSSMQFGSTAHTKYAMLQQIAGAIILAAEWYKDRIGLLLFADSVSLFIPPAKGKAHVERLLTELFTHRADTKSTNFQAMSDYILKHVNTNVGIFIASDFIDQTNSLSVIFKKLSIKREIVALVCSDKQEQQLSDVGYVWMQDCETGDIELVDTKRLAGNIGDNQLLTRHKDLVNTCNQYGIDSLVFTHYKTCMYELLKFFHTRMLS